jgi:membrane protease subunit HflK
MSAKSFESFTQILNYIIKYFKWVVAVSLLLSLLSGVYQVESGEAAVVLRFGRLAGSAPETQIKHPGLHFSFPFFIDEVIKIPVQTVLEKEITTHCDPQGEGEISADITENGYLLTGDNNIVLIKAKVIYRIKDPVLYAFYSCDVCKPEDTIDGVISGELTRLTVCMDIDSVLTSGKERLTTELAISSQAILDELKTGIELTSMELIDITPPAKTKPHFEAVTSALVKKETSVQQAKEAASGIQLSAEAQASAYKQNAVYQQSLNLTEARGEIAQFDGVYEQYLKNPQIITIGAYRQRVGAILAKMGGSVVVPESGNAPVVILP